MAQPGLLIPPSLSGLLSAPRLHSAQALGVGLPREAPPTGLSPLQGRKAEGSVGTVSPLSSWCLVRGQAHRVLSECGQNE